jgi:hypothetical protein
MSDTKEEPIAQAVNLIQSAHFALSNPDMGNQNYLKAKRNIEQLHRLCPQLLKLTRPPSPALKVAREALEDIADTSASHENSAWEMRTIADKALALLAKEGA